MSNTAHCTSLIHNQDGQNMAMPVYMFCTQSTFLSLGVIVQYEGQLSPQSEIILKLCEIKHINEGGKRVKTEAILTINEISSEKKEQF